jgi:uncharacterized membrane protein YeaQ/YmgE (transglycosylase-associated protein family)
MTIELSELIVWLVIGAVAGLIAGILIRGRGQGPVLNILVGMIGALIGGLLFDVLNINPNLGQLVFTGRDLLAAVIGSMIFLIVLRSLKPRFL